MPRHCSANSRGEAIPATVQRYVAWLATTPWHCAAHSRTAGAPHPRKRTAEPSKGRRKTMPCPCKDNTVTSGRRDRSPPSPSALCDHPRRLRRHPGHCITLPVTASPSPTLWKRAATGRRHASYCTPVRPRVNGTLKSSHVRSPDRRPLHRHPRSRSWTRTGRAMTPRQKQASPGRPSTP
jgi:hypothetical protein